jgi:predicted amidohydrolase YtcJ
VRAASLTTFASLTTLLAVALGVSLGGLAAAVAADAARADLVIVNGHVWTVDDARPEAEALAVRDGRIVLVGGNAEARALAGPGTRVIDAGGRLVLPGFQDDHAHFLQGGAQLGQLDLKDAATHEEFGRRIADYAKTKAPGEWITGGNWDHDKFPGGELPSAALIDRYCADRPVFVSRFDGHMAVANSLALRLAGITAASEDPTGGTIVRQPGSREPAGVLKDAAMEPVFRVIPPRTAAQLAEDARKALGEARRLGLTAIHDITEGDPHLRAYETVRAEGGLTARIYCRWPIADWQTLAARVERQGFGDDLLTLRSLKAFADGSIGSSTALFFTPYSDDPKNLGLPSDHAHEILEWALGADRAGLQLSVHAIGDRAIYDVLDVFERVARANGPRDRRPRIEHDQHTHPADFARHAALGVFASVQPYHAIDDGRFVEARIGRKRCLSTYAFRSLLDAGVRVGFGSDWTVAPLDPIAGIDAAVNRRTLDGKNPGGWFPEQKVGVAEAIRAYTLDNAWAAFWDDRTGSLTPGKYADVIVLDRDLLRVPAGEIAKARVDLTILAGRVVYERSAP